TRRVAKLRLGPVSRKPQERLMGRPMGARTEKRPAPMIGMKPIVWPRKPPQNSAHQPTEPSKMNSWTEAEDKVLRPAWKGRMSTYALAKRLGKTAPQIAERGRRLKLGPRPRRDKKRKCLKCQEPFVPEDWTTDWYCDKHRRQRAQMSEDLTMQVNALGRARV
ncbi:hypothetical protein LCGC14_2904480, partial [marine sediment metagenome]